jgi:hypothetical protein
MLLAHYINFSVHIILTVMACIVSVDRIWYFTSHNYEKCSVSTNFGCCTSIYYHNICKYQPALNRQKPPFLQIIACDQDKCPTDKLPVWFPQRKSHKVNVWTHQCTLASCSCGNVVQTWYAFAVVTVHSLKENAVSQNSIKSNITTDCCKYFVQWPFSPDLACSNFHFSGSLKKYFKGTHFSHN